MKTLIIFNFVCGAFLAFGQKSTKQTKVQTIVIHSDVQCGDCEERIEGKLNFVKGIKLAEVNLDEKTVTVKFNSKKITIEQIKKEISLIGYSADEISADNKAQTELPKCCQPGGMK